MSSTAGVEKRPIADQPPFGVLRLSSGADDSGYITFSSLVIVEQYTF